jgi:hypothetical protein
MTTYRYLPLRITLPRMLLSPEERFIRGRDATVCYPAIVPAAAPPGESDPNGRFGQLRQGRESGKLLPIILWIMRARFAARTCGQIARQVRNQSRERAIRHDHGDLRQCL